MKITKRILAILLSLILGLSMLAVSASAAPGGTITLNNTMTSVSINGRVFNAYRIFDVTTDGSGSYAYTFANASVQAYFAAKLPSITTGAGAVAYVEALGAEAFAKEIYAAIPASVTPPLTTATGSGTQAVFTGLTAGYFLIFDATTGATITKSACILTTNDENVKINLKWDVPTIDKTITNGVDGSVDATTADEGDVINFRLASKVPDMTGYTSYDFVMKDALTNLTLAANWTNNLVITINGVVIAPAQYTVVTAPDLKSFSITFINFLQYKALATKPIVATYSATFTPGTPVAVGENDAYVTYSNNPLDDSSHGDTPHDKTKVYCIAVILTKVDGENNDLELAGATFNLYKFEGGSYVLKQTLTTDATGIISFGKLGSGQYRLVETVAPAGYNLLTDPIDFTITAGFTGTDLSSLTSSNPLFTVNLAGATLSATVENNSGNILPGTGGIGVTIFYITSITLMLAAAAFFIYRKKMAHAK